MTPEELQRNIDFILQSHANSSARMDRLEAGLTVLSLESQRQKETVQGLLRLSQQFLTAARLDQETRKKEIAAERAERIAENERARQRVDSIEEMTRVLRGLLEERMRRPDNPPEAP